MREWITIKEAQKEIIGWSESKLRDLVNSGKVKGTRRGKGSKIYLNRESLIGYLEILSQPMGM